MRIAGFLVIALLAFSVFSSAETYVVAHFPYGGGWGTRLLISNSSPTNAVSVELDYFNQAGQAASVPLDSGTGQVQTVIVPPNGTFTISSDPAQRFGTNPVVTTWATATTAAGQPVNILELFDFAPSSTSANLIGSAVGAASTAPGQSFRFPIVVNGTTRYTASMAIANPSATAATITLNLLDNTGAVKATSTVPLQPKSQTAVNVPGIAAFAPFFSGTALFTGSVGVCSNVPIGFVALGAEQSSAVPSSNVLYSASVTTDYHCN
ncbi:MAG: hypothetical protein LAP61_17935 [Acidobacteriia bacterium]|nr:hypothetical protein [Terriglobia bacterium]